MIKEAMSEANLAPLAVIGLVTFVAVFCGVAAWVMSRSRRDVSTWASLPLADGTEPVDPRLPVVARGGCGKCENCDCEEPSNVA